MFFHPVNNLLEPLVLLASVVLGAQVHEVNARLGRDERIPDGMLCISNGITI